ncbi:MAG: hypothetical protein EOM37_08070 [Proteobacteria bacterium]|jgi:hypothetical protein|nr:hypothetical protein [Alphaproteobacteria bacterium]NCC03982.1 hypothetical protein [Pseudomonadota bacterium]
MISFLRRKVGRAAILFIALAMLAGAIEPRPARATLVFDPGLFAAGVVSWVLELSEWSTNQALLTGVLDAESLFLADLEFYYALLVAQIYGIGHAITAELRLLAETDTRLAQARLDSMALNARLAANLDHVLKKTPPSHEYLCKSILSHMNSTLLIDTERDVSRMIGDMVRMRYRTANTEGRGLDMSEYEYKYTCDEEYGLQSANPIDGQTECVSNVTGTMGQPIHDAHLLPPDGVQPLTVPELESATVGNVTAMYPSPQATEERFFMAAVNNIVRAAGPRPTPITGEKIRTPVGYMQRAMYNHCVALESALVKQCSDVVAYYTRPNCSGQQARTPLCEALNSGCSAGTEGIMESGRFGGCEKGMSPYESALMAHTACFTNQHYVVQSVSGATHPEMMNTGVLCTAAWDAWQEYIQVKEQNCTDAMMALTEMESCWNAVEYLGERQGGAGYVENKAPTPDYRALFDTPYINASNQRPMDETGALPRTIGQ